MYMFIVHKFYSPNAGTVGTVLIKDNKKECIFVIKIEDLEVKSKAPVGGVFKVERIDAR